MTRGHPYGVAQAFLSFPPFIALRQDGAEERHKINVSRVSLDRLTAHGFCLCSGTTFE